MPAILAKLIEKRISRKQHASVTAQSKPLVVKPSLRRDMAFSVYAYVVVALILSVLAIVVVASFVRLWPYNMSFTLKHYEFDVQNGHRALWNSVGVSLATAFVGVAITALTAIVVQKFRNPLTGPSPSLPSFPQRCLEWCSASAMC